MKRIVSIIVMLGIGINGCSPLDLSTPEKSVESLYYAISKKDSELYVKCFYEDGELKIGEIKYAADYIFKHLKIIKYRIIERQEISFEKVNLRIEEVSQRENGLKVASIFIVKFIKVGKEWKVFNSETIETRKIEEEDPKGSGRNMRQDSKR